MVNKNANKLTVIGDSYQKFLDENIIDGCLDFSVIKPIPEEFKEGPTKKLFYAHLDSDVLYLQYELQDTSFTFTTTYGILKMITDFDYPNSFYYWSLFNWNTPSLKPEVKIEHIENGVVIRFLTLEDCPSSWALKLNEAYDNLKFDLQSLGARGHRNHLYTNDENEMTYGSGASNISPYDLSLLDCTLDTKTLNMLVESLSN